WASVFGLAAYTFGQQIEDIRGPMSIIGIVVVGAAVAVGFWFARHYEAKLEAIANPTSALSLSGISVYFDRPRRSRRDDRDSATRTLTSRRRLGIPILDLSLRFFAGDAVALLDPADELLSTALDLIDVVIGQLAPALANFPLELQPLAFE